MYWRWPSERVVCRVISDVMKRSLHLGRPCIRGAAAVRDSPWLRRSSFGESVVETAPAQLTSPWQQDLTEAESAAFGQQYGRTHCGVSSLRSGDDIAGRGFTGQLMKQLVILRLRREHRGGIASGRGYSEVELLR